VIQQAGQVPTSPASLRIADNQLAEDEAEAAALNFRRMPRSERTSPQGLNRDGQPQIDTFGLAVSRQAGSAPSAAPAAPTTPCPTSVSIGTVTQANHSNLPQADQERFHTYLVAHTRMNVGPGPDHTGHCMKESLTLVSNSCPAAVYARGGRQSEPCTGDRCLDVNRFGSGPTAFLDDHRTRVPASVLEGTGVDSCAVACDQVYTCDRVRPTTGKFRITRNYRAGRATASDGTSFHITSGTVTKAVVP
jgi:hypothetical protein